MDKITPAHAQARHDVALLLDAMGTLYGAIENLGLLDWEHVENDPDVVQAVAVWTEVAACRNADGTVPDDIAEDGGGMPDGFFDYYCDCGHGPHCNEGTGS